MEILKKLELPTHPNLIQSFESGADAGIYKLDENTALAFSIDFFPPVVNDPFIFGQIAAANALSDIYVCGAKPLLCLNVICFPQKELPVKILEEILKGGLVKIKEAGALLLGGHSLNDTEPKYGLAVLGIVHPSKIISNKNAQVGDLLYLTKPIGTGILITAYKGNLFSEKDKIYHSMIKIMTELNNKASQVMQEIGIKCATDITGFGLIGHALEMALASNKKLRIYAHKVPIIKEALEFASMGIIPEGNYHNLNFCNKFIEVDPAVDEINRILLVDAQTSGGVLMCVPRHKRKEFEEKAKNLELKAVYIGEVKEGKGVEILP